MLWLGTESHTKFNLENKRNTVVFLESYKVNARGGWRKTQSYHT